MVVVALPDVQLGCRWGTGSDSGTIHWQLSGLCVMMCTPVTTRSVFLADNLFTGDVPVFRPTVTAYVEDNCWTACSPVLPQSGRCTTPCVGPRTDPVQTAALRAVYVAAGGPSWTTNTGWSDLSSDPCTPTRWYGKSWAQACKTAAVTGGEGHSDRLFEPSVTRTSGSVGSFQVVKQVLL